MKTLLFLFVAMPGLCMAQKDYCKSIKKSTSDLGVVTYTSPDLKQAKVFRQVSNPSFFALHIHLYDEWEHFGKFGARVEFEDGTSVKDDDVKVVCSQDQLALDGGYSGSSSATGTGKYLLQVFFPITGENAEMFRTRKIKQVEIDNVGHNITDKEASKIMAYILCMEALAQ